MGVQQAQSYLEQEPRGLENIREYFHSMHYEPSCRGCLMTMTINQRNLVTSQSMDIVRNALGQIEQMLLTNLFSAHHTGQIRCQEDCPRLATFFLFSIQGITTMGKYEGDQSKLDGVVKTILTVLDNHLT